MLDPFLFLYSVIISYLHNLSRAAAKHISHQSRRMKCFVTFQLIRTMRRHSNANSASRPGQRMTAHDSFSISPSQAPAELKTAMEYRVSEISTATLKRKLASISNTGDVPHPMVDELDGITASGLTSSASVPCLSTAANMGRWLDTITEAEMLVLQQELADFLFTSGLPFSLVDKPTFRKWVNHLRPAFEIPHRREVATTMLTTHMIG
ncbi:hypothetical protein V1527DRAFT_503891 [Lipomyces starkeyi]